eukprot:170771-Rhodomonas_salina.1
MGHSKERLGWAGLCVSQYWTWKLKQAGRQKDLISHHDGTLAWCTKVVQRSCCRSSWIEAAGAAWGSNP